MYTVGIDIGGTKIAGALVDIDGNIVTYDETAVQAYIDAHAYIAQRQQAYPSIADQLDILYHSGFDAWKSAIQAVKEEFPK